MDNKPQNPKSTLIPPHGGYRNLKSYQTAEIVYKTPPPSPPCQGGEQGEVDRFIDKRSRTHDQMVQAARSGVQNIAEGSMASGGFTEKLYHARQQAKRKY